MRAELLDGYGKTKAVFSMVGNLVIKPIVEARRNCLLKKKEEEARLKRISTDPLSITPKDIALHKKELLDNAFQLTPPPINIGGNLAHFYPIAFFQELDRWNGLTPEQRRDETLQAAKQKAIKLKLI